MLLTINLGAAWEARHQDMAKNTGIVEQQTVREGSHASKYHIRWK